jgi:pyruvate dehydrogenase E1 component alpha subunit
MHMNDPRVGVMATSGIVAGGLPIANGLALHSKLNGTDAVTVTNFGDGATNEGAFHEALNLASVWKLPVLFVCQNNLYGEYTPQRVSTNIDDISVRAQSYGIPGITVNGNDPDETYAAAADAIARARAGEGPTLLEAKTYRFMGHVFGMDTMPYMPKDEYEAALAKDPVPAYRARLIADGDLTEEDAVALEGRVQERVDAAIQFGLNAPAPDPADIYTDVYHEVVPA